MSKGKSDEDKLPWIYRLILKLPKINLDFFSDFQGIYWAIVIPIFLVDEFFLSLFLLIAFPFPINLVVASVIPIAIFVIFVKVQLERFMNWWNSVFRSKPMKWDIKEATEKYIKLLEKQDSERRNLGAPAKEKDRKED